MRWGQMLSRDNLGNPVAPKWGDGTLWGQADTVTSILTWAIEIDWNNTGVFDGSNEMPYIFNISVRRGRKFYMNSGGSGFQPVDIGEATIQCQNESGRFDAYNPDGPLYGLLLPGRRFRIRVKRESDGAIKDIFSGRILDIRPNYGNSNIVTITAQDDIKLLKDISVKTSLYTMLRYNNAITNLLSTINWQNGTSIDSVISDTMPYYWADGSKKVFDEITDLVNAVLGLFFVAADGSATYYDRLNSPDPLLTLTDADWQRDYGVRVPQPWEVVRNNIRVYSRARLATSTVEIWRLSDVPLIPAGASITIWATFSYNSQNAPATSVVTPVATTDYTGSVSTADISVVMTTFASSAKLVVTNNNAGAQTVTLLKLRGILILADQYTYAEDSDTTSIAAYGQRDFEVNSDWLQDVNSAIDQVYVLLAQLSYPKQFPRVMLKNNPAKQFEVDLFDILTLDFTSKKITGDLRVGYIEYQTLTRNLENVSTILYFEPDMARNTSGTWIFPAAFGLTTVF
jgi:hypothetical protein